MFDNHVWVWSAAGDPRAEKLRDFSGTATDEASWFFANLAPPVSLAPLTAEISLTSCRLPDFHGDPADRIIVATAITLGIPLITGDERILR